MSTTGSTGTLTRARRVRMLGPIGAVLVLTAVGWWVYDTVRTAIREELVHHLQADLGAAVSSLEAWYGVQGERAALVATDPRFVPNLLAVAAAHGEDTEAAGRLGASLAEHLERMGVTGFLVADTTGRTVASDEAESLGGRTLAERDSAFVAALGGEGVVTAPFFDGTRPTVVAMAPVKGADGGVAAVLGLRISARDGFARPFLAGRSGASRETFAFDREGLLLSPTRFPEELARAGLVGEGRLTLRDPGAPIDGRTLSPAEWNALSPTHMAAVAATGRSGVDVDGYRSYLGVPVVGAWEWIEERGFAVGVEVSVDEAFGTLVVLRNASWLLLGLLLAAGAAGAVVARHNALLQRKVQKAERAVKKLGQYSLLKKIGEGGMGEVYFARHAMLRRPCAIKLLRPDKTDARTIDRFEREVQQTSRLTHPNTIQIYDYGRTPGGTFYYVMEYLDGVSLDEFVSEHGPLSEGRVIYILRQICASLNEAHGLGLVHRDIKPANIALCRAGGAYDVVKVLDFGLVMNRESIESTGGTVSGTITGTPAYLSPEAITNPTSVDGRSDLYAVGAVGYYLLTGEQIFAGDRVLDLINKQLKEKPVAPSERANRAINPDLERAIMACLEKPAAKRPKDANALARELDWCRSASDWNRDKARHWWQDHEDGAGKRRLPGSGATPSPSGGAETVEIDFTAR